MIIWNCTQCDKFRGGREREGDVESRKELVELCLTFWGRWVLVLDANGVGEKVDPLDEPLCCWTIRIIVQLEDREMCSSRQVAHRGILRVPAEERDIGMYPLDRVPESRISRPHGAAFRG